MKCPNCGKDIQDNARFCNKCGFQIVSDNNSVGVSTPQEVSQNNTNMTTGFEVNSETDSSSEPQTNEKKPFVWKEKYTYICIACAIVLAAGIGFAVKLSHKSTDTGEINTAAPYYEEEERFDEDELFETDVESKVDEQVSYIRDEYNNIVERIKNGEYEKRNIGEGTEAYYDYDEVKAIVVSGRYSEDMYSKYFYYNYGELFFAYYENKDANRFYFADGKMIRWIYSVDASNTNNSEIYDLDKGNEYSDWEYSVLQEGNDYLGWALNSSEYEEDYILPNSDSTYLTMSDLEGLSAEECRLARNELYARHGRRFDDEALRRYFESKDWYNGTVSPDDFQESVLNDYEMHNRDLIVEYEEANGYR